jgi:SAM-dependent methyltransferase
MPLTAHDWHRRFTLQSQWTRETRKYLYHRAGTLKSKKILDVGCGTGALTDELIDETASEYVGLDINQDFIQIAEAAIPSASFLLADAHWIPFKSAWYDICLCHYLLLWVEEPDRVIEEMRRVTKPGGAILVLAEPDYGGRIDFPPELAILNHWQTEALRSQEANPNIGRELRSLLNRSGLSEIEVGVIGAQWRGVLSQDQLDSEWEIIHADLEHLVRTPEMDQTAKELREKDFNAWGVGDRVLYVPTFYGWGKVVK